MISFSPDQVGFLLLLARLLVCSVFVTSAFDKFSIVPEEVAAIRGLGLPAPKGLELLTGTCEAIGCAMLISGIGARIAAVLLAVFTVAVTILFLRWWSTSDDPARRLSQRNTFFSNLALVGALIYIAVLGPGILAIRL